MKVGHRKYGCLVVVFILLCTVVLSGCNTEDRKGDNSVIVAIQQNITDTFDPYKANTSGTKEILFNIFEGLVKCDINGKYLPALAKSLDISEDALSYKFVLRDDVYFHNSKKLIIEDVVYSLNVAVEKAKSTSPLKLNLQEIKEIDENTLELKLKDPDPDFLPYLSCAIIPCDYDKQETKPVGTGPFKFEEFVSLEKVVLIRNENYYAKDKMAKLDKVIFKIVSGVDSALIELKAGGIDIFPYLTLDKTNQVGADFEILEGNQNLLQVMALNNSEEPFNDIRVRQAINYALNKKDIIKVTSYEFGVPLGTNMSPKSMPDYYNKDTDSLYNTDIQKAKDLLAEAGYGDGLNFTIKVPSEYQFHVDTVIKIADQLKEAGITANIEQIKFSAWMKDVYEDRKYQATIIGLTPMITPRDALARYNSTANDNFMKFNNDDYDRIFALAIKETNEENRIQYYKELQMILAQEAASVYIQDPSMLVAVSKRLAGYSFYPYYVQDMSTVYYAE